MDRYMVSAVVRDKNKSEYVFAVEICERSSEVIPVRDKELIFLRAADKMNCAVIGQILIKLCDDGAEVGK